MILLFVVIVLAILLAAVARRLFIPILILGGIGYAINWWNGDPTQREAAASATDQPSDQRAFCEAIASADKEYEPERKAWYDATNPIVKDDITPRLAAMRNHRDAAIYAIVAGSPSGVKRWLIKVTNLSIWTEDHGAGAKDYLNISGEFLCPNTVTFKAAVPNDGDYKAFFRQISKGDRILVSGTFISHDATQHTPAEALDWDAFEGSAMASPSYQMNPSKVESAPR